MTGAIIGAVGQGIPGKPVICSPKPPFIHMLNQFTHHACRSSRLTFRNTEAEIRSIFLTPSADLSNRRYPV